MSMITILGTLRQIGYDLGMYEIRIREGKEKVLCRHNPWVFSGAIESVAPSYQKAGPARVLSHRGEFIAHGWYDTSSHIILHLLSWDENIIPDDLWLERMVKKALARREGLRDEDTNCCRLIHGEADFIPGLVCDAYADELRLIISSRYANDHLSLIIKALFASSGAKRITVIPDSFYGPSEKLKLKTRVFTPEGETKDERRENILFKESGIWYEIENSISQKSGFYCDQRDNRNIVESYCNNKKVLDCCAFTGAFTLHALRGGAREILSVDSSQTVLRHLLYQIHLNENRGTLPSGSREKVRIQEADVFDFIRTVEENYYDMIILDPPKLASTKSKLEGALRAYKDLNRIAMLKIKSGGLIATFSCSGSVKPEIFRQMIAYAASDAGVEVQILRTLGAGADHPVRVSLPETEYLKGLIIRVIK